jgi:hypothetical protein
VPSEDETPSHLIFIVTRVLAAVSLDVPTCKPLGSFVLFFKGP